MSLSKIEEYGAGRKVGAGKCCSLMFLPPLCCQLHISTYLLPVKHRRANVGHLAVKASGLS